MKRIKLFFCLIISMLISNSAYADTFNQVLKSGELHVGVSLAEPWIMQDKEGNLTGFEIQVAEQLAKDMGVQLKFKVVNWEDIIDTLVAKQIDIIIAGLAITPSRALRLNYSIAYADGGIEIAASIAKTKHKNSLNDLNNPEVTIGVVSDTVSESLAKKMFNQAQIQSFKKTKDAENAVIEGKIHALISSSPIPQFLALKYPEKIDVPLDKPLVGYKTGMAVNKGEQEFLNYLNAWITARDAEGWLPAKQKFWFESLDWKN
jgi:polar amino acid transport system substrate-binding protein